MEDRFEIRWHSFQWRWAVKCLGHAFQVTEFNSRSTYPWNILGRLAIDHIFYRVLEAFNDLLVIGLGT